MPSFSSEELTAELLGIFDDLHADRESRSSAGDPIRVSEARWKLARAAKDLMRAAVEEECDGEDSDEKAQDLADSVGTCLNDLEGHLDLGSLSADAESALEELNAAVAELAEHIGRGAPADLAALHVPPHSREAAASNVAERQHGQTPIRTSRDIARLVKERRKAMGQSQADLAKSAAVNRGSIIKIERDSAGAQVGIVLGVLAQLGITLMADHPLTGRR